MFKVSYFFEVLPIIASKVNITFELTVAATIFALIVGVIIAIIGYYKIPVLYQLTRVYVSIMRGTPVVAQLYFFYYGIALYVSAKYCYAAHESRLHQNDRCKRFALCLVLTVRFRSLAPWGKLFQLFI